MRKLNVINAQASKHLDPRQDSNILRCIWNWFQRDQIQAAAVSIATLYSWWADQQRLQRGLDLECLPLESHSNTRPLACWQVIPDVVLFAAEGAGAV